jgi:hypothetical protein
LALNNKQIEDIEESDLQALIDNQVSKRKHIDYKRDAIGKTDSERKEFSAVVFSFTNSSGGHIVIGVDEEKGLPTS